MWHYRVIKKTDKNGEPYYGIYESYWEGEPDKIWAISQDPMAPFGETLEDIKQDTEWFLKAFERPVIDFDTLKFVPAPWDDEDEG